MKIGPGKAVKVVSNTPELYMALDENGNYLASKSFLSVGILVSLTRATVKEYKQKLTDQEKKILKDIVIKQKIDTARLPELNSIMFFGGMIQDIRTKGIKAGEGATNADGTLKAFGNQKDIELLDKLAAVVDDDLSFTTRVFIVK